MDENDESDLLWLKWIGAGLLVGGVASLSYRSVARRNRYSSDLSSSNLLTGKTVVITGANSGIGQAAAIESAKRGADVVLACRDMKKCEAARQFILTQSVKSTTTSQSITALHLDLLDLKSITRFANQIDKCNILINNAGAVPSIYKQVGAGIKTSPNPSGIEESVFGNHIGSFYLTQLLLPTLLRTSHEKNSESKVVFVSSRLEKYVPPIDPKTLIEQYFISNSDSFDPMSNYSTSKHLSLLASYELATRLSSTKGVVNEQVADTRKLYTNGTVTVNNISPGVVNTGLPRYLPTWLQWLSFPVRNLFLRTPEQGADTIIWAISSNEVTGKSGKYYFDRKEIESSSQSNNSELRAQVYDETWKIINRELDSS